MQTPESGLGSSNRRRHVFRARNRKWTRPLGHFEDAYWDINTQGELNTAATILRWTAT